MPAVAVAQPELALLHQVVLDWPPRQP